MATLRTISYGYEVRNGVIAVQPEEAKTVAEIFSLYVAGKTLQNISDMLVQHSIPYYMGEVRWNKNSVKRIIDNAKYIGDETYPRIIAEDVFKEAHKLKDCKGGAATPLSPILEYFKEICVCGKCGTRYKRINTWGSREKWMCADGCKTLSYVTDSLLENAVLNTVNRVIGNNELLDRCPKSKYEPSKSVLKEENELIRLLEQPKISFAATAKHILQSAALRFDCCEFDRGEVTQALQEEFSELDKLKTLDLQFVKQYIRKMRIYQNGKIGIVFYNNSEVEYESPSGV